MEIVIKRLHKAGLQINVNKYKFKVIKVKYLGLIITLINIEIDTEKVATIIDWGEPFGLKNLQKFLGFMNFYHRFIKDYSKICVPFYKLFKCESPWYWGEEQVRAFGMIKIAFSTQPVLTTFDYSRRTVFETDSSD